MSRFLPRSLGGQLVALLLAGLVLAQVLTIVVFFDERRQAIRAARQLGLLERIASIVRLIEATPPALHDRILATVGSSRIRFAIAGDSALKPSDGGPRAQRLTASLEEMLPPGRREPARLGLSDDAGGGPGRRFAVWGGIRDRQRVNLTVSVPLAHGGWLNVGTHFRPHRTGWAWPYMVSMLLMAATGVLAGSAQYCLTEAFRIAPPSVVAPFEYTSLLWAMLFGFLVWEDVPSTLVLVSAAVVIASGIDLLRNERATQTRKREEPQPVILPPGA